MRYERSLAVAGRLDSLLKLIRSGAYSTPALAVKLGVCEQTVYRDILSLKQRGYMIQSRKLTTGWAYQLLGGPDAGNNKEGASGA